MRVNFFEINIFSKESVMECEKIYMNGLTRRITTLNEKIIYSKNQNDEKIITKVSNNEGELNLVRTQRYTKEVCFL
jgi:hypothetical protein